MDFTEEDLQNIKTAQDTGGDIWNNELLADLKTRIKRFYRTNGSEVCCYCRRDFQDEFNMVIDIEHILPKSKYREYMFELGNLNISCKRCNMRIKKEKDDFIVDTTAIKDDYTLPEQYLFVHPNFDAYKDNMRVLRVTDDDIRLTKYISKTDKGSYTYIYFQLDKLEVNSLNVAQGMSSTNDEIANSKEGSDELKRHLELLLSQL